MKCICIGRNYAAHAAELGNAVPTEPVMFIKPASAVLPKGQPFSIPAFSEEIHYELELLVKIKKAGKHIAEADASQYFDEIGLGIDFTARDLQDKLKAAGLPWEKAKAFDGSAVIGDFISKNVLPDLSTVKFELRGRGKVLQHGDTSLMLYNIQQLIAEVSRYFSLEAGDILFTGTPAGVAKVLPGDLLEGWLEGHKLLSLQVK